MVVCSYLFCCSHCVNYNLLHAPHTCYQINFLFAVGYHNGGLCLKDRNLIESLFLKGDVQILCTTNTLAHGINLPAHTVVIKSTQHLYVNFHFCKIIMMKLERTSGVFIHQHVHFVQQQRKGSLHGNWPIYNTTGLSIRPFLGRNNSSR